VPLNASPQLEIILQRLGCLADHLLAFTVGKGDKHDWARAWQTMLRPRSAFAEKILKSAGDDASDAFLSAIGTRVVDGIGHHRFPFSPISTRRRIASGRVISFSALVA
jgi:hypothetical protein